MKYKKTVCLALLALFFVPLAYCLASGINVPSNTGLPDPPIGTDGPVIHVISNVLRWILRIFVLLAVISFIITGIQYILSMGDTYKAEKAKNNFVYSTVAVAVVAGAMIIILTINMLLA